MRKFFRGTTATLAALLVVQGYFAAWLEIPPETPLGNSIVFTFLLACVSGAGWLFSALDY